MAAAAASKLAISDEAKAAITLGVTTALAVGRVFIPLAYQKARGCFQRRVRKIEKIRTHCLVLPPKAGKTWLTNRLQSQSQYMVIDLDEHIARGDEATYNRYLHAVATQQKMFAGLLYGELANDFFLRIKQQKRRPPVLFITSNFHWADEAFKNKWDAVFLACPEKELFETSVRAMFGDKKYDSDLEEETIQEKRVADEEASHQLRDSRADWLSHVPRGLVKSFRSLDDLEGLVRTHLGIAPVL